MTNDRKPEPQTDSDVLESELPTPSQSGSSGGGMQREIGTLDEEKSATGGDPQPTSVHKGMKPRSGDEPNLPDRDGPGDLDKVPPRRTN